MSILIADSGSTKTDWILLDEQKGLIEVQTAGINPVRDSSSIITSVVMDELLLHLPRPCQPSRIYFYGAGCMDPYRQTLIHILELAFPSAKVYAESDLLGAARALCGRKPGIACILGTGSNSGLYDGEKIIQNVSPLGYILGDEGSGAVLGRLLINLLLKGEIPSGLVESFMNDYKLTPASIIDRVYRQPKPNLFLASLAPFLARHREIIQIHKLLVTAFRQFINLNVRHYKHPEMPINFVGGIAESFHDELQEAIQIEGYQLGKILRRPILQLGEYHQNEG